MAIKPHWICMIYSSVFHVSLSIFWCPVIARMNKMNVFSVWFVLRTATCNGVSLLLAWAYRANWSADIISVHLQKSWALRLFLSQSWLFTCCKCFLFYTLVYSIDSIYIKVFLMHLIITFNLNISLALIKWQKFIRVFLFPFPRR